MNAEWSLVAYALMPGACGGSTTGGGAQSDDDIEVGKDASAGFGPGLHGVRCNAGTCESYVLADAGSH